ncbi:MAG: asparagine synthase (glutamine-hydrolyzing) [Myxococcota bacterium]|nr:asparagine synthase (glutamine-hydrolyzing) [Myxococcota bacterium]
MCGIAGYIGKREISSDRIEHTLELMRRRGPDQRAHKRFATPDGRTVDLLFSRLAIIDLDERSNQPLEVDGSWLVFNGELYNYLELKQQLDRAWRTTSDSEVFGAALRRWGTLPALDKTEGMYAFASYDPTTGSVVLGRDRFGEKPLYFVEDEHGITFGSEVKLLASLRGERLPIDPDHLKRYLVNGYKALYKQPRHFFRGLQELPAASAMTIDASGRRTERFWTPTFEQDEAMSRDEAVAGVRERLIRSVELRLRADVPIAFCQSGGVDSSSLISIAKKQLGYNVHGFTIASADERYEESALVQQVVDELGLRHTSIPTDTAGFLPRLRELVRYHDAPVYTITYYAHWLLMEAIAKHGYRISVSGTAADELFTGYYDHFLAYLAVAGDDAARAAWTEHVKPVVRNPFLSNPDLFVKDKSFRDHIYLDAEGFAQYLHAPWSEPFEETLYSSDVLRNRMANELFHEATPVILHEDDLNAMYYSIENRSPFLDRPLFEFSTRIPTRHLMRDGYAKSILRDAMRGIVPDPILDNRTKVGFNAPIFEFLDPNDAATRAELLAPSPIWDVVRKDKIVDLLDKAFLPNSQSKFLFYFLCSKLFLEENA